MLSIRRMAVEDIPASQTLLSQLGYRLEVAEVRRHFDAVARFDDHAVIVAAEDGRVIALCHMYGRPALDNPPEAMVQALMVDQAARGLGIGKMMMAAAGAWAVVRGFNSVTLGSHVSQSDAHAFYESLGYLTEATSHQMREPLGVPP
jgi:GNAT superfamily N-acetyltransferase